MVDVTPLVKQGTQIIQSYANGAFRVSGESYGQAVFVMPGHVALWDVQARSLTEMAALDFRYLADQADEIDVVLLGTGTCMQFMPAPLKTDLKAQGLSVEVMDTGAACRTYNVLMAEGRRVAAALLPA